MLPSLSSVSHLLCLWEERDSWGACPSFAITKRKGQSHTHPGRRALQAVPGGPQYGRGVRAECAPHLPVPPSQELKKPCLERGQKDSEPPDPQMLHEHILRGTRAPGRRPGHPSPSPLPGLPHAAAQVFAQFADPKVLHFPARPARGEGQSC